MRVEVVPARKRGTPHSPDEPEVVAPLLKANYLVLGPGSPTGVVRLISVAGAEDVPPGRWVAD